MSYTKKPSKSRNEANNINRIPMKSEKDRNRAGNVIFVGLFRFIKWNLSKSIEICIRLT